MLIFDLLEALVFQREYETPLVREKGTGILGGMIDFSSSRTR